jgi:hypothetical protein
LNLSFDSSPDSIDHQKDQSDAMIKAAAATPTDGSGRINPEITFHETIETLPTG